MKKILKKIIIAILTVSVILTSSACANNGGDGEFGGGGNGKTTVRFYSFNNADTNAKLKKALEEDFYVKYPNIKIQTEISTGSFYTNLLNDFSAKKEADIFGMEPGEIYPFLSEKYLEPLDGYFEKSSTKLSDIYEVNAKAYAFNYDTKTFGADGKTYAVLKDWTTDTMLYYNRAMFTPKQLAVIEKDENKDGISDPMTFAEFEILSTELLKKSGSNITQYSFLPGMSEAKILAQFLTNAGISWFDKNYESTFDQKATQDVLKYYYNILGANEVNNTGSTFMPMFAQGKVAMVMGGFYCVNAFGLDSLDLGVAYPPVKEKGMESKPYTTGCVGFGISSRSKVKDAAFKFIEWYLNYYGKKDAEQCNNFPAIKSYTNEIILNPEINTNKMRLKTANFFYKSLDKAVVIDRNPYCSQASLEAIQMLYTGEYLEGAMTFDDFWKAFDFEINKRVNLAKQSMKF